MSEFSTHEKTVLQLGFEGPYDSKEHALIRKILDHYPWIIEVADHKFNKRIADAYVLAAAQVVSAKQYVEKVIAEEKKSAEGK